MQHVVWIPSLHRDLTAGAETVSVPGETVGDVGFDARLCEEGKLRPNIAVAVNGEVVHRGLSQRLNGPSEVHFIPALSGG